MNAEVVSTTVFELEAMTTLTGYGLFEAIEMLDEELPPQAYKAIPGAAGLTDIDSGFMRKVLNEVFGLCGIGWGFTYDPDRVQLHFDGSGHHSVSAVILDLTFWYKMRDANDEVVTFTIPSTGGSANSNAAYALKGAVTSAIGNAASNIGFQESVYCGLRSHRNVGRGVTRSASRSAARSVRAGNNGNGSNGSGPGNGKAPEEITLSFGKYKGQTLGTVAQTDPGYLKWLVENARSQKLKAAASTMVTRVNGTEPPSQPPSGNGNGNGKALQEALGVVMPFGTRNHPDYKGKTLGELEGIDEHLITWLSQNCTVETVRTAAAAIVDAR